MGRRKMPPTRVKGVRLSKDLWDEVEADARKRGVSANAEAARRIESASHRQASPWAARGPRAQGASRP